MPKLSLAFIALALSPVPAHTQIIVSAHDGKQVRVGDPVPGPFPDEVVTLRMAVGGVKVLGRVEAPATLNGPPVSIAIASNGRFALVSNSQRLGPDNKLQPYGIVSMIDLADPTHPAVLNQIEVCAGAMGVALNRAATLALVACANDDAIAVLSVENGRTLKRVGSVALEPKAEPRDVVLSPRGDAAYAVRFGDGKITKLAIAGTSVTRVQDITVGTQPDGAILTGDGRFLYNTNFGGTPLSGAAGAISTVDLKSNTMVAAIAVGQTPEHVVLSPNGRYLVAVVGNGSAFTRTAANYATVVGRLKIFRAGSAELHPITEAEIGHNCQGATFSDDGKTILVQCAVEKTITTFSFDGKRLTRSGAGPLTFDARPAAIATIRSR